MILLTSVINLTSKVYTVNSISKGTKAKMFKDIEVGDKIRLTTKLHLKREFDSPNYSVYLQVTNITKKDSAAKSFYDVKKYLNLFGLSLDK